MGTSVRLTGGIIGFLKRKAHTGKLTINIEFKSKMLPLFDLAPRVLTVSAITAYIRQKFEAD